MNDEWRTDAPEIGQVATIIDKDGLYWLSEYTQYGWSLINNGFVSSDCITRWKPVVTPEERRLRDQAKQTDEILEACWRYFDHCLRVSLPRESCDSGELMVRMTLMRDAQRLLGLIGPLPGGE